MRKLLLILALLTFISACGDAHKEAPAPAGPDASENRKKAEELGLDPDIFELDPEGRQEVLGSMLFEVVEAENQEEVKKLIKAGVDVNTNMSLHGDTPLHIAVGDDNLEMVELLLGAGARLDIVNEDGLTPLHVAVSCYEIEIMETLLKAGANVAAGDNAGRTPLHVAVREFMDKKVLELLVENGADVNALDREGKTPLDVAMQHNCHEAVVMLRKHGARNKGLRLDVFIAARYFGLDKVKEILESGADANCGSERGWTALHLAASRGNRELADLLLAHGARVDVYENHHLLTPLYCAVVEGHKDIAELLLSKGADINADDTHGNTLLHSISNLEMAKWLLEKGCLVNPVNRDGKTPLDFASTDEMRGLLRSHGAVSGSELEQGGEK
jgi:cytohesin